MPQPRRLRLGERPPKQQQQQLQGYGLTFGRGCKVPKGYLAMQRHPEGLGSLAAQQLVRKGIPPLLAQTPSFEPKSRVWARSGLRALVSSQLRPPVPQSHMQQLLRPALLQQQPVCRRGEPKALPHQVTPCLMPYCWECSSCKLCKRNSSPVLRRWMHLRRSKLGLLPFPN